MSILIYSTEPIYYVYVYIDPRNSQPFYVGKGKGLRFEDHLYETIDTTQNKKKFNKIQKIKSLGLSPIIQFHIKGVPEEVAYLIEEELIKKYGRHGIDPDGILTNLCKDARPPGMKGKKHSEKTKQKMRLSQIISQQNPIIRQKISESKRGNRNPMFGVAPWNKGKKGVQPCSDETRKKMSESHLKKNKS